MHIVATKSNVSAILSFMEMTKALGNLRNRKEMQRGVIDAGRKMKTKVQRTVTKQMALKAGNYQSYVVANTRGVPRAELLAYDIFSVKGGTDIEEYRGLKVVSRGNALNKGRRGNMRGVVKSSVWNNPRVFKRSFEANGDVYAFRPPQDGMSTRAPKIFWTFGNKPNQPRGAGGKFASPGVKYGKVRRLFGPALSKEIPQDETLMVFMTEGPAVLQIEVEKRLAKIMRF